MGARDGTTFMNLMSHRIPAADFAALATGDGTAAVWAGLRSAQISRRVLIMHALVDLSASVAPDVFSAGQFEASRAALTAALRAGRDVTHHLLLHPQIGSWAAHCLRRLSDGGGSDRGSLADDLGHLGAVAAVAALRAGVPFEVRVRVRDEAVMFPAMGLLRVPGSRGWATAKSVDGRLVITTSVGEVAVPTRPAVDRASWFPLRRLTSRVGGQTIDLILDDLDPFRFYDGLSPAPRLDDSAVAEWQAMLDRAWEILVDRAPARAEAIAAGLTSLVPLEIGAASGHCSATSGDAVGAAAFTPPPSGLALAATLVHEFQHSTLASVLDMIDLIDLHEPSPSHGFYAPWRADPRPLSGLLQGTYAYLALADFWRSVGQHAARLSTPPAPSTAQLAFFKFARWRQAVLRTTGALAASEGLTTLGARFVAGMSERASEMDRVPVQAASARLARAASVDHRTTWRLRNLEVDPEQVAGWTNSWLAGASSPAAGRPRTLVRSGRRGLVADGRLALMEMRLADPERFWRLVPDPASLASQVPDATHADALLVSGDKAGAAEAFLTEIARSPGRVELWAGLAASSWVNAAPGAAGYPEAVRALYDSVSAKTGHAPDPDAIAAWLATAFSSPEPRIAVEAAPVRYRPLRESEW